MKEKTAVRASVPAAVSCILLFYRNSPTFGFTATIYLYSAVSVSISSLIAITRFDGL